MQLIILATAITSVFSQNAIIRTKNGPISVSGYNECRRTQGTALSTQTDRNVVVQLFRGRDCGRGSYRWATGNYDFNPNYDFQAIRLVPRNSQRSASESNSQYGDQGGEDQEASFYNIPDYYYNRREKDYGFQFNDDYY